MGITCEHGLHIKPMNKVMNKDWYRISKLATRLPMASASGAKNQNTQSVLLDFGAEFH